MVFLESPRAGSLWYNGVSKEHQDSSCLTGFRGDGTNSLVLDGRTNVALVVDESDRAAYASA